MWGKKRSAVSLAALEIQIKTSLRQARMSVIKETKTDHTKEGVGKGIPTHFDMTATWPPHCRSEYVRVLTKRTVEVPWGPAEHHLSICRE